MAARIFDKNPYRERYYRYWKIPQEADAGEGVDFKFGRLRTAAPPESHEARHRRGRNRHSSKPKNRKFPVICLFFRNKAVRLEYYGTLI